MARPARRAGPAIACGVLPESTKAPSPATTSTRKCGLNRGRSSIRSQAPGASRPNSQTRRVVRGLFPDLGHPLDCGPKTSSSSNRLCRTHKLRSRRNDHIRNRTDRTVRSPPKTISDSNREQLFFGKVDRLGRQGQVEDLVRALHLGTFAQAHADVAGRFVALLEQDGLGSDSSRSLNVSSAQALAMIRLHCLS